MIKRPQASVKRHSGVFNYNGRPIRFQFWSRLEPNQTPDTIIFLGTLQTGRIAKWATQKTPAGTIVVEGARHWNAHPNADDLYDFMYGYTLAAFQAVSHEFSLASAHIVAQSQAAPGAVLLGKNYGGNINNIVLLAPLGFAATIFGSTPRQRVSILLRRIGRTLLQPSQLPIYDPRNLYIGLIILRGILRESNLKASPRKYAKGLAYDMREDCRVLVERQTKNGNTVTILLGSQDKLFTTSEIPLIIKEAGIQNLKIHILPGVSHLSLAVRKGKKVLHSAVAVARNDNSYMPGSTNN